MISWVYFFCLFFIFIADEPKYYWWEITVIFKKMLLTGAMGVIAAGSSLQLILALLIVLFDMLLVLKIAPFLDDADDYLSFLTSLQMLLTLLGGLMIKTDSPTHPQYDPSFMGPVLVFINSLGFFALIVSLTTLHPKVRSWLNNRRKNDDVDHVNSSKVMPSETSSPALDNKNKPGANKKDKKINSNDSQNFKEWN